jgi:hypothetical protein
LQSIVALTYRSLDSRTIRAAFFASSAVMLGFGGIGAGDASGGLIWGQVGLEAMKIPACKSGTGESFMAWCK